MKPAPGRLGQQLDDLIQVIHFTEDVSVKVHGLLDKGEILTTIAQESLRTGKYAIYVFLLDDNRSHLRSMGSPASPLVQDLRGRAHAAGVAPLNQFSVNVDESALWRPVIRDARIVECMVADVVREMFPQHVADLILDTMGHGTRRCVLAPLHVRDEAVGALGITSTGLSEYFLPSVRHLAQHISQALALAEADRLRNRAEQALRESETALRAVLNATPEGIFLADAQSTILVANEAMAARFGMSLDQLVGSNAFDILPPEVAAHRRVVAARELPSGQPFRFEDRRQDRVLEVSVYPVCDAQGRVQKIAVFSHDITALRRLNEALQQSEGRFRQMAEVTPVMFWMVDPVHNKLLYLSSAAERIYGYEPAAFCRDPHLWEDTLHHEDRERVLSSWQQTRGKAAQAEYRIVRADGQIRWVRDVATPTRNESGELTLLTGFVEDITERVQAEAQIRQADKMASLGLLAGGVAHGLRNPLAVISACAQMLLEYPDDKPLCQECAQKINTATQRASQIIENLLRLARPQDVQMTVVDVPSALQEVLVLLADHLLLHRIALEQRVKPGLPAIRGNAPLLQQVFVDLLLNACNAMAQGGTLTVSAAQPEPGWLEIAFRDTGSGIPREMLGRVFDPFFTTAPSGVGLGLCVSYSIIQQHGGTIHVESTVGQGTTFTIRLPVAGGR